MTLREAAKLLADAGIESALGDARVLFEKIGGYPRHALIGADASSDSEELARAISRRAKREPLQYILGRVDFYRESYKVTPDCLIPRWDTELLVDYAVSHIPEGESFLDLCTGSGCVAISTLANTKGTSAAAYDISDSALKIAKENAEENGVSDRLKLFRLDLMTDEPTGLAPFAVLSNPPYVSCTAYAELAPEIAHEPSIAFLAGKDGGDFYRRFVPMCKRLIKPEGFFAFEIGFDQRELSEALAAEHGLKVEILKDTSGNDRVAVYRAG